MLLSLYTHLVSSAFIRGPLTQQVPNDYSVIFTIYSSLARIRFFSSFSIYFLKSRHSWLSLCLQIRGQLLGISSFLPPCEFQGSNAAHQRWWQASSSTGPSHQPGQNIFSVTLPTNSNLVFRVYSATGLIPSGLVPYVELCIGLRDKGCLPV